jgi:predicted phosphate transport protein (TIGR00153 family)
VGKRIRFMPTEEEFFQLFDEIADVLVEAAVCLRDLTLNYDECEHRTRQLREMEKRSDVAADTICERLNISFVTPIDREDIHALAKSMDDVLDYIEASADRMKLYGIDKPREEAVELAEVLVEATKLIKQAVAAVSNLRKIEDVLNPCIEINKLENQGDAIQRKALKRLFAEETRPLEVAKWQEIFDRMEIATDRCEDVANVLESIVVKNA